jgi:hypothetical protein
MEFINTDITIDSQRIVNDPERERIERLINSYIDLVNELANVPHVVENLEAVTQEATIAEVAEEESSIAEVRRDVDECVYQLCSKQDRVYTKQENPDEDTETWTLALWDGHGSTHGAYDPVTKKFRKDNFMLDCLDQMIINGREIDEILEKDIFSEDDPVITLQRALGKKCIEKN